MSGGISNASLLDLTNTTLKNLPELKFEVALEYQTYPVCNQWFQGDKVQITSGTSIERNIILDTSGNARHVRLYQKTPINVADVHFKISAPWVQVQTHWSIERREALRNRKPAMYIDLLQSRRVDATVDLADLLEQKAWDTPSSSTDDLHPYGLPYWLSLHPDGAITDGFNGYKVRWNGGGTASNTKGGINGYTYNKWRNWVAGYTSINNDFIKAMRKAFHATNFTSPMLAKDLREGPASKFRIYMGLDPLSDYEDMVTTANDNLGPDLDPFHGNTTFKRVPIVYTPVLDNFVAYGDSGTANSPVPIFGVNHAHFHPFVQDGDWMREEDAIMDLETHNVMTGFIDGSYNFFCNNVRQAGFVIHKALTA